MNAFYKEQKRLHQNSFDILLTIEAHELAAAEIRESGVYEESEIERHSSARIEELKTSYALTATTLMQNFCSQMGFELKRKPTYLTVES